MLQVESDTNDRNRAVMECFEGDAPWPVRLRAPFLCLDSAARHLLYGSLMICCGFDYKCL